jgi:hypothetical protein
LRTIRGEKMEIDQAAFGSKLKKGHGISTSREPTGWEIKVARRHTRHDKQIREAERQPRSQSGRGALPTYHI